MSELIMGGIRDCKVSVMESNKRYREENEIKDTDTTIIIIRSGRKAESANLHLEFRNSTFVVALNIEHLEEAVNDLEFAGIIPDTVLYSHDCIELLDSIKDMFSECDVSEIPIIFKQTSEEFLGLYWYAKRNGYEIEEDALRTIYDSVYLVGPVMDKIINRLVELNGNIMRPNVVAKVNEIVTSKHILNQAIKTRTSPVLKDGGDLIRMLEEVLSNIK